MRNAGRLKLGYYPLPIDEARNIRSLLVSSAPYAAIDPCVGDGTALIEITKEIDQSECAFMSYEFLNRGGEVHKRPPIRRLATSRSPSI
jgi:hypothetical protein